MTAVNPGPAMVLFDSSGGLTPFYADVEAEFTLHNTAGRWIAGGSVQSDLRISIPHWMTSGSLEKAGLLDN